ncbi:MAG: glutamine-hydrolyzing GMP synthase [Spirochaetaceae bacterium]|jgi:GMP synthase (glutamine-hydrolysing)|nr:glutamine-hydrolyzing GMP synthase [Spirochaetaceae bacterium]
MEKILILDFGSQTTALIGRRVREMGVYAEVIPGDSELTDAALEGVRGIILGGSPESVYGKGAKVSPRIYECGLPLLGICYGLHRITADLGGIVAPLAKREFGAVEVRMNQKPAIGLKKPVMHVLPFFTRFLRREERPLWNLVTGQKSFDSFTAWMSHGDTVVTLAPGFVEAAKSATGYPAIVFHTEKPWFGVQFHPEVSHCEHGNDLLAGFVLGVCECSQSWNMGRYLELAQKKLKEAAAERDVLLLISGGVDSTVTAALLLKTLPPEHIYLMYIDTGLMRQGETEEVKDMLTRLGARHLSIVDAEADFLGALAGLTKPEEKRKVIGDLFITVQEREVAKLTLADNYFLAQGTLYTDLIESGKGVGAKAHLIKTHHNVGSPLVDAKRKAGLLLEPLDCLYKDEVREAGRLLGLTEDVVMRHPFPGPGLAVRVLGEVTKEKCAILRAADKIFIDELKRRASPEQKTLYSEIWQAFAVLLPLRSVGVAGDGRQYGYVLSLRAVTSSDGMTADVYPFEAKDILEISTAITNAVPEIGRVCYDVSSKPPATIEWE